MKKTVSLILALVLCLALAAPALAVDTKYDDGDQKIDVNNPSAEFVPGVGFIASPAADGAEDANAIVGGAVQGVAPWAATDASMTFIPSVDSIPSATDIYYTVHEDDTLAAIAFAFYGNSNLAQALYTANANGHFLVSGGVLESQRPLRIPTKLAGVDRLDIQNPLRIGDLNGDNVVSAIEYDNVMRAAVTKTGDYGYTEIVWDEFYWNFYPVTHFSWTILWNSLFERPLDVAYLATHPEDEFGPSYTWAPNWLTGAPEVLAVNDPIFDPWTNAGLVDPTVIAKQNGAWNEEQVVERMGQVVYIVRAGDTLDSIAKTFYAGNGINTYYTNNAQHLINAIKAANVGRITGNSLTAGQYIIIPVITIGY